MKGFLTLVLIVGVAVAGWMSREKLSDLLSKSGPTSAEAPSTSDLPAVTPSPRPATPNPAHEAQAQATALYPGLARTNSALNQEFVALYKDAQAHDPALLSRPDWPLTLADRAMVALGGAPLPHTKPGSSGAASRAAKQVVIYTTSSCPYCKQAKQYFAQKGIPYREVNIETSHTGDAEYRRLGGNGVPLIMVGDQKVDGFNAAVLDRLLL